MLPFLNTSLHTYFQPVISNMTTVCVPFNTLLINYSLKIYPYCNSQHFYDEHYLVL